MIRPHSKFDVRRGLLHAEHFQMAYATNDIDRACAIFRQRYGIQDFRSLEGPLPSGGQVRIELAWVGTIMYELISAQGEGSAIYMDRLPTGEGFAMRHHHLGYLIPGEDHWQALMDEVKARGQAMPHESHNAGFMKSCFVDAPELGHYLEYLCPEPAGLSFFENVPGN